MTPNHHLHGQGCPKCRYEKTSKTKTKEQSVFIEQAKKIYGNFYDYSETVYVNDKTIIDIICPIHGNFSKTPNTFLHGHDCQECSKLRRLQKRTYTTEKFIEKAQEKHNNFYSYGNTKYKKGELEVIVTCPIHGDFNIIARNHLFGQGCKKCNSFRSKGEREVEEFVKSLGFEVETTNRKILNGEEIDIYIPSKNVAIEYNGLRWHSEEFKGKNYHLNKTIQCQKQGIQLIHIFEDEWKNKCEIVKSYIKSILGINEINLTSDGYTIQYISTKETKQFIKTNCLEEYHNSSIKIGVIQKEQLISIMTFKKVNNGNAYQIVQYCNKKNYNITNSIKIILDYFINTYKPSVLTVNVDRRYNNGKLYEEFGFIKVGETKLLCYYIQDYQRTVKFVQNALKIYDCGKICYEYKIEYNKNKHER